MNVKLRQWKYDDVHDIVRFADNSKIANNLRDSFPHPYKQSDGEEFIKTCIELDGKGKLFRAISACGKAVGSIGIFVGEDVYSKSAELGYWLAESYWGKGIMTDAVGAMCRIAFESFDIVRIFAEPYAHNTASRRVLEKAGFKLEGIMKKGVYKNGHICDYCMYALLREDYERDNRQNDSV